MNASSYNPRCFDVRNITEAKAIILTPDSSSTDERWTRETPYLADLIVHHMGLDCSHRVLDYGCGIGRLSKALIERCRCAVLGVDQSVSMRALASAYVESDQFVACAPTGGMLFGGLREVHHAIAVWSLQHIPDVEGAILDISRKMLPGGKLLVVNAHERFLPVEGGRWIDDDLDVREHLGARFKEVAYGGLDPKHTSVGAERHAFWGVYQRA